MIVLQQQAKLLEPHPDGGVAALKKIEYAARNCYASQDKITNDSCYKFVNALIKCGHDSPLEFASMTFDITTSRAVLAEITRHRLSSFCVESQRYIQENKTGDISFIAPVWLNKYDDKYQIGKKYWNITMSNIEDRYKTMIESGMSPQEAREILPNSTACRIIMEADMREWRHIFKLRLDKAAYPQIRELMKMMLTEAHSVVPVIFDDIYQKYFDKDGRSLE